MVLAGILLAVYAAGMVVPLALLAAVWNRLGETGRRRLRGREFTLLGRRLHTTTFLTGLVIIALGILFWATNGLVTLPSLIRTSTLARWQSAAAWLNDPLVQIAVIAALGLLALGLWWRADRRRSASTSTLTPGGRP